MPEELSAADRSSLAAEQGPVTMAVGGVLVFEGGPGMAPDAVLERIGERLHLIPRYRQRLQMLAPGVTNPVWVDDASFTTDWHLRYATLPPDDAPRERLAALVGRELSRRLDRSRPLWEMTLVDGLEDGRVALVPKMHHALVDGVAAVDIGTVLLDPTPEPMVLEEPEAWSPSPYDRRRHLARLGVTPFVRGTELLLQSAQRALTPSPRRTASDVLRATELLTELARTRPQAPMTPLNAAIGPNRSYAMLRAELAALKAFGKASGATVNDVILAAVAGMLARYLAAAGARPDADPVALVPVSVRRDGEEGGNRISTVLVDLPVGERDPRRRIATIHATMQRIKDSAAVRAGALLVGASGWAPPLVSGTLARAMSGVRAFNLVVSNVPGPQQPFYLNGSRLLEVYPAVPLNPSSQGLTVGVLSYDGGVHFGLLADRALAPGVDVARGCLADALAELT